MSKTKKQLLKDMMFIEEHSEYVYEGDYTYNELSSFVSEHLEEAQSNQWDYCHSETEDWLYREQFYGWDIQ